MPLVPFLADSGPWGRTKEIVVPGTQGGHMETCVGAVETADATGSGGSCESPTQLGTRGRRLPQVPALKRDGFLDQDDSFSNPRAHHGERKSARAGLGLLRSDQKGF